jgi:hypothetical protein
MDLAFSHCFAEQDVRLDDVLSALRRERTFAAGKEARSLADRAVREIERQRYQRRGPVLSVEELLDSVLAASPYGQITQGVKRGRHALNPIMSAIEAARHAVEDRRIVRHLLAFHISHAAKVVSKSALVLWTRAKGLWRKLLARASIRYPARRANGFFGSDKVDGRNLP